MRALAALALSLLLAGCGFHPLYATPDMPTGAMQDHLRSIYVEPVPERIGYQLRNQLVDLLDAQSEAAGARYVLRVTLSTRSDAIGVQSQTVPPGCIGPACQTQTAITRYNDKLTAEYELVDTKSGQPITRGVESGLSSYNVLSSPYATLAVQQDADRRAAEDIADRIRIDLAVWFSQQARK